MPDLNSSFLFLFALDGKLYLGLSDVFFNLPWLTASANDHKPVPFVFVEGAYIHDQ